MKTKRAVRSLSLMLAIILSLSLSVKAVELISVSVTPEESPAANYAPIAENLSFTTFKEVSIHGEFAAVDPEGDVISFRLAEQPKKGTVEVSEQSFIYTPNPGKKGKDIFTYVAMDSFGNTSETATVSIKIEKQNVKLSYSDMTGNGAHYAAIRLAEEGIYIGEQVGNMYYFNPDDTIKRSEFLTMCMSAVGMDTLNDITRTGFSDDNAIPTWAKPYVSTALMAGMIQGYSTNDGEIVFSAENNISYAEAMVMLNNALKISDVGAYAGVEGEALPVWAAQAAANLNACSIISTGNLNFSSEVTRADAALMLCSALDLIERRGKKNDSLLSWAW